MAKFSIFAFGSAQIFGKWAISFFRDNVRMIGLKLCQAGKDLHELVNDKGGSYGE